MWSAQQYDRFLQEAYEYLGRVQDEAKETFNLGAYERYDWSQNEGTLVFSEAGVAKVVADIQFVGSISSKSQTWLWSWANSSLLDDVKHLLLEVKQFGETHGIDELSRAKWPADESDGWAMTAIAAYILQSKGAYRSPGKAGFTFLIFTDIRWAEEP